MPLARRTYTPTTRTPGTPHVEAWGRLDYGAALRRQLDVWSRIAQGDRRGGDDVIAVVEHPPVVTLGRHAPASDVLLDVADLQRRGIAVARTDRGGRATYHGPGQAVVYPIVDISARSIGVKPWVELLEDVLLETLAGYDLEGRRIEGRPGIWVDSADRAQAKVAKTAKIASLGLRVARGVSYHGISLNVEARSKLGFEAIVTCGVQDQRVTSIADERPAESESLSVEQAAARFVDALLARLQRSTGLR